MELMWDGQPVRRRIDWARVGLHVILAIVGLGVAFLVVDCAGGHTEHVTATVRGREHVPSHTYTEVTTTVDANGQAHAHVSTHTDPEQWNVLAEFDGSVHTIRCSVDLWPDMENGRRVEVTYRRGCMTGLGYMAAAVSVALPAERER